MNAAIGLRRTSKHFYLWNDNEPVPGITTVQGMLDKSGPLVGWAKRETAKAAVRNAADVLKMLSTSEVTNGIPESALDSHPAVAYLKAMPGYERDKAADVGSAIHRIAEDYALERKPTVTDEQAPYLEAFIKGFVEKHKPKFHPDYIEYMVYSEEHRYGGTMDVACRIGDDVWLIDYKTSKGIYPETSLQLAAGHYAEFMGKPNDTTKHKLPPATRFGVVHIRPEGAYLAEYPMKPAAWEAFLAARTLWGVVNGEYFDAVKQAIREAS